MLMQSKKKGGEENTGSCRSMCYSSMCQYACTKKSIKILLFDLIWFVRNQDCKVEKSMNNKL